MNQSSSLRISTDTKSGTDVSRLKSLLSGVTQPLSLGIQSNVESAFGNTRTSRPWLIDCSLSLSTWNIMRPQILEILSTIPEIETDTLSRDYPKISFHAIDGSLVAGPTSSLWDTHQHIITQGYQETASSLESVLENLCDIDPGGEVGMFFPRVKPKRRLFTTVVEVRKSNFGRRLPSYPRTVPPA